MSVVLENPGSEPITPGDTVELSVLFTNGTPASAVEPPAVTLEIKNPDGSKETPAPSKVSLGKWHYQYEPERPGRYYFYWDGDEVAAVDGTFVIARKKTS